MRIRIVLIAAFTLDRVLSIRARLMRTDGGSMNLRKHASVCVIPLNR